jgi:formate dehydrogenase subunit delta
MQDNLIRMANQIATFFDSMPDRQEALLDWATHIHKFWEPRMRQQFLAKVDAGQVQDMHALVLQAVQQHRALLE